MARAMPSMLALLGLLAVAGYQNRDKIGEAIGKMQGGSGNGVGGLGGGLGRILSGPSEGSGGLGGLLSGLGAGGLSSGLDELMNGFRQAGHATTADSWVNPSVPTQSLTPEQVEQAIGPTDLGELAERTGLSKDDILSRLATAIPGAVDKLTPDGQMPTETQVRERLGV